MQVSQVYSNRPDVFAPIVFHCRDEARRLNVVFGEVRKPQDQKRDSHNLGKTTLLNLIDFLFLRRMSADHFLAKNAQRFQDFVFFLEVALNTGDYATIRRGVTNPNRIALTRHSERGRDFVSAADDVWNHTGLSRDEAVLLLDGWLDLKVLRPYDYRKAITYFLRAQGDYTDELQLQKFRLGKDRDWKPFIAHLFAFNESSVQRKYELDELIDESRRRLSEKQSEVRFTEDQLPEVTARIGVLSRQADDIEAAIDAFRFDAEERRIIKTVVEEIEAETSEINERLYNIRYDINQIAMALDHRDRFDIGEISEVFREAQIHFPDQLKKSYEDLVAFNRKVTQERNAALRKRRLELIAEEEKLSTRKDELDTRREQQLHVLRSTDTFEKFKSLQKELARQRAQLVYLEEQKRTLEEVADLARMVREQERERGRVVDEIKAMVAKPTPVYERFASTFNNYCQRVLNHDGFFFFRVNASGNFDYQIGLELSGQSGMPSSQSEGTSYKKLVCALFDLALLKTYEDSPFFHFVYHDGILEGLDNRKKLTLLAIVREQIASAKTQYIFTLIDSDVPRDASGNRIEFGDDEVILRLNDEGADGRLFKMAEF